MIKALRLLPFHSKLRQFFLLAILIILYYYVHTGLFIFNPFCFTWLLNDNELAVFYFGWDFYRIEPWAFPIGQIQNYLYPLGMNIFMTDIPILALLLKPFTSILPEHFQYVGLWLLLGHLLQAWFALLLCERFEIKGLRRLIVTLFLVFCPVFLIRFQHPTLFAHWMVLACLHVYFMDPRTTSLKKYALNQFALIVISALVMVYLWLIVLGFSVALFVRLWLVDKKVKYYQSILLLSGQVALSLLLWITVGLISFGPLPNYQASGWGDFSVNLNAFLNPINATSLLPTLPHFPYQTLEGYAYLGAGVLVLIMLSSGLLLAKSHSSLRSIVPNFFESISIPGIDLRPLILLIAVTYIFALSCNISFNQHILFHYELGGPFLKMANSFRASGRFVWPMYYFILLILFKYINKINLSSALINLILASCLVLQIYDLKIFFLPDQTKCDAYNPPISDSWKKLIQSFDKTIFYPGLERSYLTNDDYRYFTYYASQYHKKINVGYAARLDYHQRDVINASIGDSILSKGLDDRTLYITTHANTNRLSIPIETNQALYLNLGGYIAAFKRSSQNEKLLAEVSRNERDKSPQRVEWAPLENKDISQLSSKGTKLSVLQMDDTDYHFYLKGWTYAIESKDILHDSIQLILVSKTNNKKWFVPAHRFDTPEIALTLGNPSLGRVGFGATLLKSKLQDGVYRVGLQILNDQTGTREVRWTDTTFVVGKHQPPMKLMKLPPVTEEIKLGLELKKEGDEDIRVVGWAFPTFGKCSQCKRFLVLSSDSISYQTEFISGARPDVVRFFNDTSLLFSGVNIKLRKSEILRGSYSVGVLLKDTVEKKEYFAPSGRIAKFGVSEFAAAKPLTEIPTGKAKVRAYFDKVEDADTFIQINGWAFLDSVSTDLSICTILFKSSDAYYEVVPDRTYRPDLKGYFQLNYSTDWAGFSVKVNKDSLPPGQYEVCVLMHNTKTSVKNMACMDVQVEVSNAKSSSK